MAIINCSLVFPSRKDVTEKHAFVSFGIGICIVITLRRIGCKVKPFTKSLKVFNVTPEGIGIHSSTRDTTDSTARLFAERRWSPAHDVT